MSEIRSVTFAPYDNGPQFRLVLSDSDGASPGPRVMLAYRLEELREDGSSSTLFSGEDFGVPPIYRPDGAVTVHSLMSFLCLRPGDTAAEYFADYTPAQLEFADQHAEGLILAVDEWYAREIDVEARNEVEGELAAAGIIEDPNTDGGILG